MGDEEDDEDGMILNFVTNSSSNGVKIARPKETSKSRYARQFKGKLTPRSGRTPGDQESRGPKDSTALNPVEEPVALASKAAALQEEERALWEQVQQRAGRQRAPAVQPPAGQKPSQVAALQSNQSGQIKGIKRGHSASQSEAMDLKSAEGFARAKKVPAGIPSQQLPKLATRQASAVENDDDSAAAASQLAPGATKWTPSQAPGAQLSNGEKVRVADALTQEMVGRVFAAESFHDLGLSPALADHIQGSLKFDAPTHIQKAAIPHILAGRDVLVHSDTGTGKTMVYLAPVIHFLQQRSPRLSRADGTFALILAPTRELCLQICAAAQSLVARYVWLVPGHVMGGENKTKEKARLRKGVTILVATPGRLLDHLKNTSALRIDKLKWLVLDEADRLLDLGFERDLLEILAILNAASTNPRSHQGASSAPASRQTMLLSATLGSRVERLATVSLSDPVTVGHTDPTPSEGAGRGPRHKNLEEEEEGRGLLFDEAVQALDGGGRGGRALEDEEREGTETYRIPSQLAQSYYRVPCRMRLVALATLLRYLTSSRSPCKMVVFFSTCDAVEFHHAVLSSFSLAVDNWRPRAAPAGSGRVRENEQATAAKGTGEGHEKVTAGAELVHVAGHIQATAGPAVSTYVGCALFKLHGNLTQKERAEAFFAFKRAPSGALLCTDVAARGLDFPLVTCIVQYDPPGEPADYVHRVGRTARLGQRGEAFVFLQPAEGAYLTELFRHKVILQEQDLGALLDHIPLGKGRGSQKRGDVENHAGAALLQARLEDVVAKQEDLQMLATDSFRSFVRAYAAHRGTLKPIFHPRRLHLGHVARSCGLADAPSLLGHSSTKQALKRKKDESAAQKIRKSKRLKPAAMAE